MELEQGTIDFMAAEVIAQEFLFLQASPDISFYEAKTRKEQIRLLPFHFNAIHDIELVWWLGVWMMNFFKPEGHVESKESSSIRQTETEKIFPGTLVYDRRLRYIEKLEEFRKQTGKW